MAESGSPPTPQPEPAETEETVVVHITRSTCKQLVVGGGTCGSTTTNGVCPNGGEHIGRF